MDPHGVPVAGAKETDSLTSRLSVAEDAASSVPIRATQRRKPAIGTFLCGACRNACRSCDRVLSRQSKGPVYRAFVVAGAGFEQTSTTAYRFVQLRRLPIT